MTAKQYTSDELRKIVLSEFMEGSGEECEDTDDFFDIDSLDEDSESEGEEEQSSSCSPTKEGSRRSWRIRVRLQDDHQNGSSHSTSALPVNWFDVSRRDLNAPTQHKFTPEERPGPRNLNDLLFTDYTPTVFFKLFFAEDLIKNMVKETNQHGKEMALEKRISEKSRFQHWKATTVPEMYKLFGILLNMGIVSMPTIQSYWSTDWTRRVPFFQQTMARDRFLLLFQAVLKCCQIDSNNRFQSDEIQPIINDLVARYQKYFVPYRDLAVYESTIGHEDKIGKKKKRGLLVKTLTDCTTGYILNINIGGEDEVKLLEDDGVSKTDRSVRLLMEPYLDRGYHVFCNSSYTSLPLAKYLHEQKTHVTGTFLPTKEDVPTELKERMPKEGVRAYRSDNILVLNWKEKKGVVSMISTFFRADRKQKRQLGAGHLVPAVIETYRKNKLVVESAHRYPKKCRFAHKTMKWWKKIFFWLIEVTVMNSYLLYRLAITEAARKDLTLLKFREQLVESLVKESGLEFGAASPPKRGRPSTLPMPLTRLNQKFHGQKKLQGRSRECKVCSNRKKGERHETTYICDTCEDKPALHPGQCFTKYHTCASYK